MSGARVTFAALGLFAASSAPALAGDQPLAKIAQCWNVGSLSSAAFKTEVTVAFSLTRAAKPVKDSVTLVRYDGGSRAAAEEAFKAARRAILRCGADGFKPPAGTHAEWRQIEITFNPESMR